MRNILFFLLLFLCSSCKDKSTVNEGETNKKPAVFTADPVMPVSFTNCYQSKSEKEDLILKLNQDEDGSVSGMLIGSIHDEANGYFTTYQTRISGKRQAEKLNLTLYTAIEYDVQMVEEEWLLSDKILNTGRSQLTLADCENMSFYDWDKRLLLQGKWRSKQDPKSLLEIREIFYIESYEGMPDASSQTEMGILDSCGGNPTAQGTILSLEDDRCFSIVKLTEDELELIYLDRGNTLSFKKI